MITLVKINPAVVPIIFYDGTNIQDFIDIWGYANIGGHNGSELSISFNDEDSSISVPINSYVLNYLGTPIVLNQTQFLAFTDEYFATDEEDKYFFLTRDELIEEYYESKRRQRDTTKNL